MKVVILAGGKGTRLAEETRTIPKPMVRIGGRPILWHIMKNYYHQGFKDFVIALGYKGEVIERYFREEFTLSPGKSPDWTVELVDTGEETLTGGRIKRLAPHLEGKPFLLTWGDGVADVDIRGLVEFHRSRGALATLTAVNPPSRFGRLSLDGDRVRDFSEKPQLADEWINGAFFVVEPEVLSYIEGDLTMFEHAPLETLAAEGRLSAYRHRSFWQCMDTIHDRDRLQELWDSNQAQWKNWR